MVVLGADRLLDDALGAFIARLAFGALDSYWKRLEQYLDYPVASVGATGVPPATYDAELQQLLSELFPAARVDVGHEAPNSTGYFVSENTNPGMQQDPAALDVGLVNRRVALRGDAYLARSGRA